jgi:PAS domain S-box-containing protein
VSERKGDGRQSGTTELSEVELSPHTERALRESYDTFHQLADNITDVFWIRSPDMRQLYYVSPAFERVWGRPVATLYEDPQRYIEFTHPADRERLVAAWATLMADAREVEIEYRIVRPDGQIRWVCVRGFQVRDAAGALIRLTGIVSDITDRKRAEAALHESEERYRALVQWSPEAIVVSRNGRLLFLNPAALRMLGATHEDDLLGKPVLGLVHPEFQEIVRERLRTTERGDPVPRIEERFIRLDGTVIDVAIQGTPIVYDGEPATFSSIRDITGSKRAAEALSASMEEFRTLAQAMPQIVWIAGPDGRIVYLNQRWTDYTGMSLEQSLGHGWNAPFHTDDQQRAASAWAHAMATTGLYSIECRLRRSDGEYRWWLIRGVPQPDAAGTVTRWFGTCTDIHDLKHAELEVLRTNRALKMRSSCNEVLIRASDEQDLLDRICGIVVESGGYRMVWVGYAQDDESRSIRPMAHAGLEDGYLSDIRVTWNEHDPLGKGPAGEVIRTGRLQVSEAFALDPAWAPWLNAAQQRGYSAAILLPLRNATSTFGLLALYSGEVTHPGDEELKLLQEMADNLAFGIGSLRAQSEQQRLQTAVVKVAAGVSAAAGTAFFEQLARNMTEALGAQAALVAQLLPGEPLSARTIAAVVEGKLVDNFDYVMKDTPCASLMTSETCVIPARAAEQFPQSPWFSALGAQGYVGRRLTSSSGQVLGLLFVIFVKPIEHVEFVTSTLQIFAARAASELERQETDAQVREQAALLDIAQEAIQVRDLAGRIIYWNKGAERIYGWTAAEARGRDAVQLLGDAPTLDDVEADLLSIGEYQGERTRRTRDHRDITVEVRRTLVRDAQGRPRSILDISNDITEKKRLESQFLRAQRMEGIGTLAGGIAHDLNNVLAPILMSLEMLKDLVTNEEDRFLLTTLEGSAQRGADLVQQVLAFARGVGGERVPVNPVHIMRDLLKVMLDTFPKNITVSFGPARHLWSVTGDSTQMHQVFLNLCVNARDAMPDGGSLTITMDNVVLDDTDAAMNADSTAGPHVVVTVEDTGTGIPIEIRDRICEPFFTTKQVGQGTGLGLSTTLAIVRSHGGFITLASEVGKGTVFKVHLPASPVETAPDETVVEQQRVPRGNGELVLVVDDEAAIRAVACRMLERFGYRVMTAINGADAVEVYARHREEIAVVLTDMAMPIMDGPALILALRGSNPEVRIIGSSGLASDAGVAVADLGGAVSFVRKPYSAEALLRTIKSVLNDGSR